MYYRKELAMETLQALSQSHVQKKLDMYCERNGLTPVENFKIAQPMHMRIYVDKRSDFRMSYNCFAIVAADQNKIKHFVTSEMFRGKIKTFHFDNFFEDLKDGQKVSREDLAARVAANEYAYLGETFNISDIPVFKKTAADGTIYYAPKEEKKK